MPKFFLTKKKGHFFAYKQEEQYLIINQKNAQSFLTDDFGYCSFFNYLKEKKEYNCSKDEYLFLQQVENRGFFDKKEKLKINAPLVLCIGCTKNCNLNCIYCYFNSTKKVVYQDVKLDEEKIDKIKKFIKHLHKKNPALKIYLTGGEPFLFKELLSLIKIIKDENIFLGIVTNATLISQRTINELKKYHVDELRISFDSIYPKEHNLTRGNSFSIVHNKLNELNFNKIPITLSSTITKINQNSIDDLIAYAKQKGFSINFSVMLPTGRGKENEDLLPDYSTVYERINTALLRHNFSINSYECLPPINNCGFGSKSMYLGVDGAVYPCNMLAYSPFLIGNIYTDSPSIIMQKARLLSKSFNGSKLKECQKCALLCLCGGACRAAAYCCNKNLKSESPECSLKYNEIISTLFSSCKII